MKGCRTIEKFTTELSMGQTYRQGKRFFNTEFPETTIPISHKSLLRTATFFSSGHLDSVQKLTRSWEFSSLQFKSLVEHQGSLISLTRGKHQCDSAKDVKLQGLLKFCCCGLLKIRTNCPKSQYGCLYLIISNNNYQGFGGFV